MGNVPSQIDLAFTGGFTVPSGVGCFRKPRSEQGCETAAQRLFDWLHGVRDGVCHLPCRYRSVLRSPERAPVEFSIELPETPPDPLLTQIFPPDAWQLRATRQLASEAGTLILENLTQIDGKTLKLEPVTLIVKGGDGKRPMLIEAPEAEVEFSGSLDELGSSQSPIAAGQLKGQVTIRVPPSSPGADDALFAVASNVWLSHREIKTTDVVRLKLGESEAVGRDLTIHLANSQGKSEGLSLDRLELIYLDYLKMPLKQGGLWQPLNPSMPQRLPTGPTDSPPEGMLRVECDGGLKFNFATFVLELQGKQINVTHRIPGYPEDAIRCERLTMRLFDPEHNHGDRPKWARFVRSIEAIGRPVTIKAPTLMAEGKAEVLLLDFAHTEEDALLDLSGKTQVMLSHRGFRFTTPRHLVYRFQQSSPEKVGTLVTEDGGELAVENQPDLPLKSLRWSGRLKLTPDVKQPQQRVLEINGGFIAETQTGGKISGDRLYFEFLQKMLEPEPADSKAAPKFQFQPLRLHVSATGRTLAEKGRVKFDLAEGYLEHERIDLWFKQVSLDSVPKDSEPLLALNRPTGAPLHQWVAEPAPQAIEKKSGEAPPSSINRPRLVSESLGGEITLAGTQIVSYDISANKQVSVDYWSEQVDGPQLMNIRGDDLRVIESPQTSYLQVKGEPARISYADGFAEGMIMGLNTQEDIFWIDRQGEIRVPTPLLASQPGTNGNPNSSWEWTLPPQFRFQGRMVLQGRVMEAAGVQIQGAGRSDRSGPVWQFATHGDLLRVTLNDSLQLRRIRSRQAKPQLQLVSLIGGVVVDASNWLAETRQSRHRLETTQIDIEPQTSLVHGAPGNYRMWSTRGDPSDPNEARNKSSFLGDAPLMTTHLIYHQRMLGNLAARRLDFQREVRVGIGPTSNWDQSLDVTKMEVPLPGQALLNCDQLSLFQPQGIPTERTAIRAPWEVEGIGGVGFKGQSDKGIFSGTCNRFSYASQKDLLMLEGQPSAPAVFTRQLIGAPKNDVVYAQSVTVRPREMEIVDFQLQGANIGNLPEGYGLPPKAQVEPANRRRNF